METKSYSPFLGRRVAIATHFDKVIRNCESLFAIYKFFASYS